MLSRCVQMGHGPLGASACAAWAICRRPPSGLYLSHILQQVTHDSFVEQGNAKSAGVDLLQSVPGVRGAEPAGVAHGEVRRRLVDVFVHQPFDESVHALLHQPAHRATGLPEDLI